MIHWPSVWFQLLTKLKHDLQPVDFFLPLLVSKSPAQTNHPEDKPTSHIPKPKNPHKMALKRINKELTDLGRYVISPMIIPLVCCLLALAARCLHDAGWGCGVCCSGSSFERGICR
jgi:hypothetical protein